MRGKLLALVLCAAASWTAQAQQARRTPACTAIADCIEAGAVCWLVQVPKARSKALQSEAFEDMESHIALLQARRDDAHFVVAPDVTHYLRGLPARPTLRTVFLGFHGRSLVYDDLFVDDVTAIEHYLDSGELPPPLRGHVRDVELRLNPAACPPGPR